MSVRRVHSSVKGEWHMLLSEPMDLGPGSSPALGNGHSPVPLRSESTSCGGLGGGIKSFGLCCKSHPGSSRRQSVLQCNPEPLPNQYRKKYTA